MLTKEQFRMFRQDVNEVLKGVADKYNVDLQAGNISYSDTNFTMKLEAKAREINGQSFEQAEFEKYCLLYGFSKSDYNREFILNGRKFYLIGFKPKASKYPALAKCEDGKNYKFSAEIIKIRMEV